MDSRTLEDAHESRRKPKMKYRDLQPQSRPDLVKFRFPSPQVKARRAPREQTHQNTREAPRRTPWLARAGLRFVLDTNDSTTLMAAVDDREAFVSHLVVVNVPVWEDDPIVCPLCLDVPVAPRISVCCSQCFCLACVVRLHQYREADSQPCPVCHAEHVGFVPASLERRSRIKVGETVDFELVVRLKGRMHFVIPVAHEHWQLQLNQAECVMKASSDPMARFCRFVFADDPHSLGVEEVRELEAMVSSLGQATSAAELEMLPATVTALELSRNRLVGLERMMCRVLPPNAGSLHEDGCQVPPTQPVSDRICFYYQSSDGQQVFADPLVQRMLLHDRQCAVEDLPRRVGLKVMTLEPKKRFGFLSHLIDEGTSEWWVADCIVSVSPSTVSAFSSELQKRKEARKREARKREQSDKRHEQRVRHEEARREKTHPPYFSNNFEGSGEPLAPPTIEPATTVQESGLFLSYAAIASADGASFGIRNGRGAPSSSSSFSSSSPFPSSSPQQVSTTASSSPSARPSFADLVKGSQASSPPTKEDESAVREVNKRGKKFVVLQAAGGGGRRLK